MYPCPCLIQDVYQSIHRKHYTCLRLICIDLTSQGSFSSILFCDNILYMICCHKDEQALSIVLEYGADPNIKDSKGSLPLVKAIEDGWEEGVEILLKAGAKITCNSIFSVNYLDLAVKQSYPREEIVVALVEAGSKPEHDYLSSIYYRRRWCLETTSIFMAILRRRLRIPSPSFPQGYPLPAGIIQEMGKRVWATRQDTSIWYICKSFQNKKN